MIKPANILEILPRDSTVNELLRPFMTILETMPGATDLYVNRPGEVWIERGAERKRFETQEASFDRCIGLANAIARFTDQKINEMHPILSAQLPGGERMQILLPPAVEQGTVSLSLRVPGGTIRPLEDYESSGMFNRFTWAKSNQYAARMGELEPIERELFELLVAQQLGDFLRLAIRGSQSIAFTGATGSGKTSIMKSCALLIPAHERLVTIEDTHELELQQQNRVHLYYSHGGQGMANLGPSELIQSALRMKPDRLLLGEIRGAAALDLIDALQTGHAGSMTTFHAESEVEAYERYWGMCVQHPNSKQRSRGEVIRLVRRLVPIIIHMVARIEIDLNGTPRHTRYVKGVHFDPIARLVASYGDALVMRADRSS
jgi:type IV secretion system protein VirB11